MGDTTRTFFAIEIPERLGRDLERLQSDLTADIPGCRPAMSRPFHMTLAFLGDVPNRDLERLHEHVASSVCRFEPLNLRFDGLGAFPSPRRPRVLWAGLTANPPERLGEIQKSVLKAASRVGYPCEDERFHPHVTLARFKPQGRGPCDLAAVMERYRSWSCGEFTAVDVVGFASRAVGAGSVYEIKSRGRLSGEKSQPST
jgi:RNA 2',3'-cyclic 3'-phosphodiesterase